MKKSILLVFVLFFTMSGTMIFAGEKAASADVEMLAVPVIENKSMNEEIASMNERLEEIRDMDKSEMSAKDKKELKKELKAMKNTSGGIYIGAGTLILVILLIVILL